MSKHTSAVVALRYAQHAIQRADFARAQFWIEHALAIVQRHQRTGQKTPKRTSQRNKPTSTQEL